MGSCVSAKVVDTSGEEFSDFFKEKKKEDQDPKYIGWLNDIKRVARPSYHPLHITAPPDSEPVRNIEKVFRFKRFVAAGSSGKVYEVVEIISGIVRACKVFNKKKMVFMSGRKIKKARNNIVGEIKMGLALKHPNIVSVHDAFENSRFVFVITEMMQGREMFDFVVGRKTFFEADAVHMVKQVSSALAYMHTKGVIHRDLKPENIMLKKEHVDGQQVDIKLIDFGFSRTLKFNAKTTSVVGSPYYVAPEVSTCTGYDASADMWSLGIVTYVLLSGMRPYPARGPSGENDAPELDSKEWKDISDLAKDFVSKLLRVTPSQRMTAVEALEHKWLRSDLDVKLLSTKNLSSFVSTTTERSSETTEESKRAIDEELSASYP